MKKYILGFVLLLTAAVTHAAGGLGGSRLTGADGLSNSSINVVFQDSAGLIWIGTWDGLNIYDGQNITSYRTDIDNPGSISNSIVREIVEDGSGLHWIATDKGINAMDYSVKTFTRYFCDGDDPAHHEGAFHIALTPSGQLLASVSGKGLFVYNRQEQDFTALKGTEGMSLLKMAADMTGGLWILNADRHLFYGQLRTAPGGTELHALRQLKEYGAVSNLFYNRAGELWIETDDKGLTVVDVRSLSPMPHPTLPANLTGVNAAAFDKDKCYLGTDEGLVQWDRMSGRSEWIVTDAPVWACCLGTQDILWIGTDGKGVLQHYLPKNQFHAYSAANIDGYTESPVRTFAEDGQGRLWIGTKGHGLYSLTSQPYNRMKAELHLTRANGLLNNAVYALCRQGDALWIGGDGEGLQYYAQERLWDVPFPQDSPLPEAVYSIVPQGDTLWIGTSGRGLLRITLDRSSHPYKAVGCRQYESGDDPGSLNSNIVYAIAPIGPNELAIGTRGGGLHIFNTRSERFEHVRITSAYQPIEDIICLHAHTDSSLWAGSTLGLVHLFKQKSRWITRQCYTEKSGLPNNTIHGMLEDRNGNLWVSTNRGIARLTGADGRMQMVNYNANDGICNNEGADGACYASTAGSLFYMGSIDGFSVFNPQLISNDIYMPPLLLTSFSINNQSCPIGIRMNRDRHGSYLRLRHGDNLCELHYQVLDYINPGKCRVAYRLSPRQTEWVEMSSGSPIVLSNLPRGRYTLTVRHTNADHLWSSSEEVIRIRKLPPWWSSAVAWCVYLLTVALIITLFVRDLFRRRRARELIALKEIEKQKLEEVHQGKLRFFTSVAHEFSNLLTLIYSPCIQLLNTSDTHVLQYAGSIKTNSEKMQRLIRELIDFREAENGHLQFRLERTDLAALLAEVLRMFADAFKQLRITSEVSAPAFLPCQTDAACAERVLFNLVSWFVARAPQQSVLQVTLEQRGSSVLFSITSQGFGLQTEERQQLFSTMESLNHFEQQLTGGPADSHSAISLAYSYNVIQQLGGQLRCESDGKSFTTLAFTLPVGNLSAAASVSTLASSTSGLPAYAVPQISREPVQRISAVPDVTRQGLVLIVDHDADICRLISSLFSERYETASAHTATQALEIIGQRLPAIIIADLDMPGTSGQDFISQLKQNDLTRHIPLILTSPRSDIESHIEGLSIGADAYIGKPFHPGHLTALVERLLHHAEAILAYGDSPSAGLDMMGGHVLKREDRELFTKAVDYILSHLDADTSPDDVATHLNLSRNQFYRRLKESLGLSPVVFIRDVRLSHAAHLLRTTHLTVAEIMYACGFNNKAYFYREFQKKFGHTPSHARQG